MDKLYKIKETAHILGVCEWTLRRWDNDGKLKAVRIGSRRDRRWRQSDIIKFMEER